MASDGSGLSYLEQEKCKRALVLQRDGRICAAECVARGDGFAVVHEWFEEEWRDEGEEFVRGKWRLVKMGVKHVITLFRY